MNNSIHQIQLPTINYNINRKRTIIEGGFEDADINFTPITLGNFSTNTQSRLINNTHNQSVLNTVLHSLQSQPTSTVRFQFGQAVRGVIDPIHTHQIRDWNQRKYNQMARFLMSNGIDPSRLSWDESDPNNDLRRVRIRINPGQ